jgi:hypothetical protein
MLVRLRHILLGASAGLIIGIVPGFIVAVLLNGTYAVIVLAGCALVGATTSTALGKQYESFWGGIFEFLTAEAWS